MALKRNRDTGDWEDVPEEEVASQPFLDPDALPPSDIAPAVEPITAEAPLSEPVPEPAPYQDPYQYTDTLPEHRGDRDAGLSEAYPDTPLDLSGGGATLTEPAPEPVPDVPPDVSGIDAAPFVTEPPPPPTPTPLPTPLPGGGRQQPKPTPFGGAAGDVAASPVGAAPRPQGLDPFLSSGQGKMPAWLQQLLGGLPGAPGKEATFGATTGTISPLPTIDPKRNEFETQIRQQVMDLIKRGQSPLNVDETLNTPEARSFQRVRERALQRFRAKQAESRGQTGGGRVAGGELGAGLGSDVAKGEQEFGEQIHAFESQLVQREMQQRRQQLQQALQLGAGMLGADQEQSLRRELASIDANLRGSLGAADIGLRGFLGGGQLSLGLLQALLQNQQFNQRNEFDIGRTAGEFNLRSMGGF